MTILNTDIKLMASQRLDDNDDGGGMMSAVEVEDGVVNNLFPDISRLDRTYGRVNLRKAYAAVRTANKDRYYGAHAIITDAPDDPRVSVIMFTTGSYTDERVNARDRIESYVVRGPESPYVLLGDQLQGQRTVRLYSRVDTKLPEVGQVYLLRHENAGGSLIGAEQYVRISAVEHQEQEFEDDRGPFTRRVYTLEIGAPLVATFPGPATASRYSAHGSPTLFRATQVADASRYYGIVPLVQAITPGDMSIKAASIYGQLVPSATVESPVVDVQAGVQRANYVQAGAPVQFAVSATATSRTFGRAVMPASVRVAFTSWLTGSWTAEDNGTGELLDVSSGVRRATIDYATGLVTGLPTNGNFTHTFTATPAAAIYDTAQTDSEKIELANRGYNYVRTLRPIPQPGTLFVDYMAQGQWYRMQDNGKGALVDEFGGAGTIDYVTGSVVATLGALPDVGSQVIFTWATPVMYERLSNLGLTIKPPTVRQVLAASEAGRVLVPGSLTLTWNGGANTATDNGNGMITGHAGGEVNYATREVRITPTSVPAAGSVIQAAYHTAAMQQALFSMPTRDGNGDITLTLASNLMPGTVRLAWNTDLTLPPEGTKIVTVDPILVARDDGNGLLFLDSGEEIGSVNYSTGSVTFTPDNTVKYPVQVYTRQGAEGAIRFSHIEYALVPQIAPPNFELGASFAQQDPGSADTDELILSSIELDLTPFTVNSLVPGSVSITLLGRTYLDRAGVLYSNIDTATGSGFASGSIDYASGRLTIDVWNANSSAALTINSALTKYGEVYTNNVYFRTPGAPLRPMSVYFRANASDGTLITATPNAQGLIDTNDMQGSIDYETGVVDIAFGAWVLESTLTNEQREESWYHPADIRPDGTIWVPRRVEPGTMKFNAVVYSMMPLDATILGLDPVRLPIDGRVPIIRNGDVVVVHSTKQQTLPGGLTAGQVLALEHELLAAVRLLDQNGEAVDPLLYSVDRAAGEVTLADPLDLGAYAEPLIAEYRIEDMALVNEAQINGQLGLVGAISRAYDPADTFVSSALIFGDLGSRVHHLFSQATWTGAWSDSRIGSNTTAQYNDLLYPLQVNNKNAIRERWAIIFTSATTFNVVGEVSGQIATGNTTANCAPVNPITGEPYFTILWEGWGGGWATNNVLRFNTDAAHAPVWIARTTISGTPTQEDDAFKLQIRGDAD